MLRRILILLIVIIAVGLLYKLYVIGSKNESIIIEDYSFQGQYGTELEGEKLRSVALRFAIADYFDEEGIDLLSSLTTDTPVDSAELSLMKSFPDLFSGLYIRSVEVNSLTSQIEQDMINPSYIMNKLHWKEQNTADYNDYRGDKYTNYQIDFSAELIDIEANPFGLHVSIDSSNYSSGESLSFRYSLDKSGYVNVILGRDVPRYDILHQSESKSKPGNYKYPDNQKEIVILQNSKKDYTLNYIMVIVTPSRMFIPKTASNKIMYGGLGNHDLETLEVSLQAQKYFSIKVIPVIG